MSDFDSEELLRKLTEEMTAISDLTKENAEKMAKSLIDGALNGGLSDISDYIDTVDVKQNDNSDGSRTKPKRTKDKGVIMPETAEKLDKILSKVKKVLPPKKSVRLNLSRGETTVFDSKMGGVPYFPKDMEYPRVLEDKFEEKPLHFIAQLNFGTLPKIEGFPTEGILQFFAGCDGDYSYGMDFDNGCNQNGFRVIYHEKVIGDVSKLYNKSDMPEFDSEDDYSPFVGEFLLTAQETIKMPVNEVDFRFWETFLAAYNELFGTKIDKIYGEGGLSEVDEPLYNAVFDECNVGETRMGGYPFFTQYDPRKNNPELAKHTVLLFQSDSENGGDPNNWDDSVCWGDMGVANFFITPEDLEKRDFSNVLFYWDCC